MNVSEYAWRQLRMIHYKSHTRWLIASCVLQMVSRSILAVVAVALGNFALNLVRRNCSAMAVP